MNDMPGARTGIPNAGLLDQVHARQTVGWQIREHGRIALSPGEQRLLGPPFAARHLEFVATTRSTVGNTDQIAVADQQTVRNGVETTTPEAFIEPPHLQELGGSIALLLRTLIASTER